MSRPRKSSGLPLLPEQAAWIDQQQDLAKHHECIRAYGPGPAGATCEFCIYLYRKMFSKTYYKCAMRRDTNGPGTDHRCGWAACGRFEAIATPLPVPVSCDGEDE